jgi:hypothetical protein
LPALPRRSLSRERDELRAALDREMIGGKFARSK